MKILNIIPPHVPSYFNAGHHLHLFAVAAYVRKHFAGVEVECFDGAALNVTWKEVSDLLVKQFDLIILMNDFDSVDTFERFMTYKNCFNKDAKVITFGRLSKQIPRFFFKFNLDAVAFKGDYEVSIVSYIRYITKEVPSPEGVLLSADDEERAAGILDSEEWVLPDVLEIPYENYNFMYKKDMNKFCGVPERQELVVHLARGCPYACHFCDVPFMQGTKDRRLSVDRVIDYVKESFDKLPFEYFSFYAPTFTLDKNWVYEFCEKMQKEETRYPWKCITVLACLSEDMVKEMAAAGCFRISLGIESFTERASMKLPKAKQGIYEKFLEIVQICNKYGVELNCFIVLGLPGDSPENVAHTIDKCLENGARIRPTIYTPFDHLTEDMCLSEVSTFNRQIFPQGYVSEEDARKYYELFYSLKKDRATQVMNKIPLRRAQ